MTDPRAEDSTYVRAVLDPEPGPSLAERVENYAAGLSDKQWLDCLRDMLDERCPVSGHPANREADAERARTLRALRRAVEHGNYISFGLVVSDMLAEYIREIVEVRDL
jgi:hypothetical protein